MEKRDGVRTFVGIDAHASQCSIKAISFDGGDLLAVDVPTNAEARGAALQGLPRPVWAIVESSTMAPVIRDSLEDVVDRVIVCETRENRWVAKSEDKGDAADADRLARLLRLGEYKEVYVPARPRQELRELMILGRKAVGDVTRAKNRIKSKYRQHGVPVKGSTVYSVGGRARWLTEVKRPAVCFMLEALYASLDAAESMQRRVVAQLHKRVRPTRVYKQLLGMPGFGPAVCSIVIAVMDDPWRFPSKRKLWKYAGLSVYRRSSGNVKQALEGGSPSGNRLLKYAAMVAAHVAIRRNNRFARHYGEMISRGVDEAMAIRTAARNLLATALAIWKNGTTYREDL